jgi:hypothetical protein
MRHLLARADARLIPLADAAVDLVVGSPPYATARLYLEGGADIGIARDTAAWVDWMLGVTTEAVRVSRGLVLWVVAGVTRDRTYQPGPEGLAWEWWRRGGSAYRPCYWHRYGISGSGGDQWYRADVEYVLAFKRPGKLPYATPTANGHAPKWAPGGAMSHRLTDGARVNQWGGHVTTGRSRKRDGSMQSPGRPSHRFVEASNGAGRVFTAPGERGMGGEMQAYIPPAVANPGNLLHTNTGGGQLGSDLAHENEAPYPEDLPAFFIASHCPPGGLVLDPFSGSGTTCAAATKLGRSAIGLDLRESQCRLGRRRLRNVTPGFSFPADEESPPPAADDAAEGHRDLPGQMMLFHPTTEDSP